MVASATVLGGGADGRAGEDLLGRVPGAEGVDGELEQRGAGDAVAVGSARFDRAGGEELVEPVGHEREQRGELVEGGGHTGFVEVHELVGGEAEDLTEIGAVAPARRAGRGCRRASSPVLEPADQLEPNQMGVP